jgi:hypothetical protein
MVTTRSRVVAAGIAVFVVAGAGGYLAFRSGSANQAPEVAEPVAVPWTTAEVGAPVKPEPAPATIAQPSAEPRKERPRPEPAAAPAPVSEAPAAASQPAAPKDPASATPAPASTTPASAWSKDPASIPPAAVVPQPAVVDPAPVQVETPKPAEPPRFEELTIKEDSVIGISLETLVTTATAKVEDKVVARVTRDVMVDGRTAIPNGARLEGVVSQVETAGKFKGRARVGIKFTQVVLNDNHRLPIQTETIFRDGDAAGGEATAKIGASAVVGAILGSVIGGKKGAAIGTAAGAGAGTAIVAKGGRNEAVIPAGTLLTVRLTAPVKVTIERTDAR